MSGSKRLRINKNTGNRSNYDKVDIRLKEPKGSNDKSKTYFLWAIRRNYSNKISKLLLNRQIMTFDEHVES